MKTTNHILSPKQCPYCLTSVPDITERLEKGEVYVVYNPGFIFVTAMSFRYAKTYQSGYPTPPTAPPPTLTTPLPY
jgi:hypothetical protein